MLCKHWVFVYHILNGLALLLFDLHQNLLKCLGSLFVVLDGSFFESLLQKLHDLVWVHLLELV